MVHLLHRLYGVDAHVWPCHTWIILSSTNYWNNIPFFCGIYGITYVHKCSPIFRWTLWPIRSHFLKHKHRSINILKFLQQFSNTKIKYGSTKSAWNITKMRVANNAHNQSKSQIHVKLPRMLSNHTVRHILIKLLQKNKQSSLSASCKCNFSFW